MISLGREYADIVHSLIEEILKDSCEAVALASEIMAERISKDYVIYVIGTGAHSYIAAEEAFYRAGGLACISPILDVKFSLANGGRDSMRWERHLGYIGEVIDNYGLGRDDVVIINNPYGVNAVTIDAALTVKTKGGRIIALTSPKISKNIPTSHPARHPEILNLSDLADVVVDTHVPEGDAVLQLNGVPVRVAGVSTILTSFCLNWLISETISHLTSRGVSPPVWQSANLSGGDEHNLPLLKTYSDRVRHL